MTQTLIQPKISVKENDVFDFVFSDEEYKKRNSYSGAPHHCFDGQFIVRKTFTGELRLVDTYWYPGSDSSRIWTLNEALSYGTLTFKCNLHEVEPIRESDLKRYDEADVFNLSSQHGYRKSFVKRKGAQLSQVKIIASLKEKIEEKKREIEYIKSSLRSTEQDLIKAETGDIENIYP